MTPARRFAADAILAFAIFVGLCSAAQAARVECLSPATFSSLARLTDNNMSQLVDLLGLPGQVPPEKGCRAVVLSGPIDAGSAEALIRAIERNKGWLGHVFIETKDGDLKEEIALAHVMRDFMLTGTIVDRAGEYYPDFVLPTQNLPRSVSNSWPDAEVTTRTPFDTAVRDYLENTHLVLTRARCEASCWTILAGAVERRWLVDGAPSTNLMPMTPSRDDRIRYAARAALGPKLQLVATPAGLRANPAMAGFASFDHTPINNECAAPIEYMSQLGKEVATMTYTFAARNFSYMRLDPLLSKVRRFREAKVNAALCTRKAVTRLRLRLFEQQCTGSCNAKLAAVEDEATKALARYADADDAALGIRRPAPTPPSALAPAPITPTAPPPTVVQSPASPSPSAGPNQGTAEANAPRVSSTLRRMPQRQR